jgi:hypothetical protein
MSDFIGDKDEVELLKQKLSIAAKVVPLGPFDLQFEWHISGHDLEIVMNEFGDCCAYFDGEDIPMVDAVRWIRALITGQGKR